MTSREKRIFRAGVIHGMLCREEQNWYQMLGKDNFKEMLIEKNVRTDFAKRSPELAAEYSATMKLIFGKPNRKRISK